MKYNNEKEKYIDLYSGELKKLYIENDGRGQSDGGYGRANWGENVIKIIQQSNVKSILDFGCGFGRFCDCVSSFVETVYGVDIASVCTGNTVNNEKIKFIDTDGVSISLPDGSVELITSFDCLEHISENDLEKVFLEFKRVATKGFIISVAPCGDVMFDVPLHLTIKPIDWWLTRCSSFGKVSTLGQTPITNLPYIFCKF